MTTQQRRMHANRTAVRILRTAPGRFFLEPEPGRADRSCC